MEILIGDIGRPDILDKMVSNLQPFIPIGDDGETGLPSLIFRVGSAAVKGCEQFDDKNDNENRESCLNFIVRGCFPRESLKMLRKLKMGIGKFSSNLSFAADA